MSDPNGAATLTTLRDFGVSGVREVSTARLFLIDLDANGETELSLARRLCRELLVDPVVEEGDFRGEGQELPEPEGGLALEVHFKPGVMDAVADSTRWALRCMGIGARSVRTARRYELFPAPAKDQIQRITRLLGNDCIEDVTIGSRPIAPAPSPPHYEFVLRHVPLTAADDAELARLSRDAHLFLTIDEMRAIREHFRALGRDPTDLELETLAQTWSEHCVHKTLKSAVVYRGAAMPPRMEEAPDRGGEVKGEVEIRYENLVKDTIMRATRELAAEGRGPECLSVFQDNAGVIAFDDSFGVAFKVETHNHPSAIEPYGGAATGVGGVIRDILGCGLGAKPIANTDVFCVAPPGWPVDAVPKGVIHPRAVLKGVVAGVRDYGNCMGIPTVNGAIQFDPRYLGNPLVFCGCVGLIPRDRVAKKVSPGDRVILIGGRTGRDGIHGATFSSAELSDAHEDEFAHAVQIGNPVEEKKILDVVLQARDWRCPDGRRTCLFSAITDCGAGGLSSAVGEMAGLCGAAVDLEKVPLKYAGLRYDEIWISEAQERMVLAVPEANVESFLSLARAEDVEATVIGQFTDSGRLVVRFGGAVVGDLDLRFLHGGLPRTTLAAEWRPARQRGPDAAASSATRDFDPVAELKKRLGDPTVASKHWVIRQYDHEVQGRSVVKPLAGRFDGPSDAAVLRPRLDSDRGIAIGCGMAPHLADVDPYWMAVAAIDEALRNVVCVGGHPAQTAILDNFCWPRVDDPRSMGALVRACQGCYDAAKAYGVPFISGKDSLNNEFALAEGDVELVARVLREKYPHVSAPKRDRLAIPPTLLISAVSVVEDVNRCATMNLKQPGSGLWLVGRPAVVPAGSPGGRAVFDFELAARTHRAVAKLIARGVAQAAHDISEAGLLAACAEMAIASRLACMVFGRDAGARGTRTDLPRDAPEFGECGNMYEYFFDPLVSCYVVEVAREQWAALHELTTGVPCVLLGIVPDDVPQSVRGMFTFSTGEQPDWRGAYLDDLAHCWQSPLDW